MAEATIERLRTLVSGTITTPGDAGYDEARTVYNAMIDKRPSVIVGAANSADVAATVVVVVAAEVLVVDAGVVVVVGSAPLTQPVPTTNNATTTATIRPLMPANLAR